MRPLVVSPQVWRSPATTVRNARSVFTANGSCAKSSIEFPTWPENPSPQQNALFARVMPHVCEPPAAIDWNPWFPAVDRTGTGRLRLLREPSPTWPKRLAPQQKAAPSAVSAQVCPAPTLISANRCVAFTAVGPGRSVELPSPSWPLALLPQQYASPAGVSPQMWPSPTEIFSNRSPRTISPDGDGRPQHTTPPSFASAPQVVLPPALIAVNDGASIAGGAASVFSRLASSVAAAAGLGVCAAGSDCGAAVTGARTESFFASLAAGARCSGGGTPAEDRLAVSPPEALAVGTPTPPRASESLPAAEMETGGSPAASVTGCDRWSESAIGADGGLPACMIANNTPAAMGTPATGISQRGRLDQSGAAAGGGVPDGRDGRDAGTGLSGRSKSVGRGRPSLTRASADMDTRVFSRVSGCWSPVSAVTTSSSDGNRSSGAFAIMRAMIAARSRGQSGRTCSIGGGASLRCARKNPISESDENGTERQEAGPGIGVNVTYRFNNIVGVQGALSYIRSGIIPRYPATSTGTINTLQPESGALTFASLRGTMQPRRSNYYLAAGIGMVQRSGKAWDVPGMDALTNYALVLGYGIRARVTPEFAFNIGVDANLYYSNPDRDLAYYSRRLQRDVLVSIGIPWAVMER